MFQMNAPAPLPADTAIVPTADHAAWGQELLRRQAERLDQLAAAGTRLALAIEQAAAEAGEPAARAEAAKAFSRVTRSVRLTGLLQDRLIQDIGRLRSGAEMTATQAREAALAQAEEAKALADPAYAHKARVEAIVARVARAETDDEDRLERLACEAGERLDDDDIYGDVSARPVGELVSLICRDLDVKPDWKRLGEERWAIEEAETGDPRSPFFSNRAQPAASPAGGGGGPLAEERAVEREGYRRPLPASWFGDSS
jgi:hypothetical protein